MNVPLLAESYEEPAAYHPLAATLAAQQAFWPEPLTDTGALEAGWVTTAALFADDAAVEDHLAYQGSFARNVDRKSCAAFLLSDYCAMFSATSVPPLVGAGLVPDFAAPAYALQFYTRMFEHDGQSAQVRRAHVRFLSSGFWTGRAEHAGHPDAIAFLGRDALLACFREQVEGHFAIVIDALHRMTGLPRSAMWRLVGDALAVAFLDAGKRYGCLDDAKAMAMTVLKYPGSALTNRQMHYFDVTIRDDACPERVLATNTFRARGGCCRYYRVEGGTLCSTCILQPAGERERILERKMRRRLGLPAA